MQPAKFAWWKLFAVWVGFLILHFSYETFPIALFKVLGEEHETTFSHMRMLFNSYLIVTLVEYIVRRAKIASGSQFWYPRLLNAVAFPWLTITIWFLAEAIGIRFTTLASDLIYANLTTAAGIYLGVRLEEAFADMPLRPALKAMIAILFVCAVLSYVLFAFNTPVHFFTQPPLEF
jgi:hypothetical protein